MGKIRAEESFDCSALSIKGKERRMAENKKQSFFSKYKNDLIVIVALILLSVLFLLFSNIFKKDGAYAEVTVNGEVVGSYPLVSDGTYTLNGGTNILVIDGGTAYLSYSDCPDHTCENIGRIKHVGETIICLPNHLTVTVVGEADDYVDFVS